MSLTLYVSATVSVCLYVLINWKPVCVSTIEYTAQHEHFKSASWKSMRTKWLKKARRENQYLYLILDIYWNNRHTHIHTKKENSSKNGSDHFYQTAKSIDIFAFSMSMSILVKLSIDMICYIILHCWARNKKNYREREKKKLCSVWIAVYITKTISSFN